MIEVHARLFCDRCNATIAEMFDVQDEQEARSRMDSDSGLYAEDEDGNDVCAACWEKFDAKQAAAALAPTPEEHR